MSGVVNWLDARLYPQFGDNWDDGFFRQRIMSHLTKESMVLDLGAGAGIVSQMDFRGCARRVCGVDLDPRVVENPYLDEGKVADGASIPYENATFDVVFADNVMEHLASPEEVFREIARVLKPGGVLLFKTPNKTHYMPLIARLTPHSFHEFFNRIRGRADADTFPTLYLANSRSQVAGLAERTGFEVQRLDLVEGRPEYLRMTAATYLIGWAYERLVNLSEVFAPLRILLVAELRRI